jgi:hypothetical protein
MGDYPISKYSNLADDSIQILVIDWFVSHWRAQSVNITAGTTNRLKEQSFNKPFTQIPLLYYFVCFLNIWYILPAGSHKKIEIFFQEVSMTDYTKKE